MIIMNTSMPYLDTTTKTIANMKAIVKGPDWIIELNSSSFQKSKNITEIRDLPYVSNPWLNGENKKYKLFQSTSTFIITIVILVMKPGNILNKMFRIVENGLKKL